MQLTISAEAVRNTVLTHESGQVLYKTAHSNPHWKVATGTTTI